MLPKGIPSITGLGFTTLGATGNALDVEDGTSWNYLDNLTMIRGHHTWKFGVEIRRIWLNNSAHERPINVLTYTSDANLMNNKADNISILRTENGTQVSMRFNYKDVLNRKNLKQNIELKPGDTVVVP